MDKEGVDEIRRFVEWLDAGPQQAGPLADELLALPVARWSEWLGAHPEALTFHLFDELLRVAVGDIEHALSSTQILVRHVDAVITPPEAAMTRAYIRGNTWRVHGDALRAAGNLHGALRAYERAAGIFRAEPVLISEIEQVERSMTETRRELEPARFGGSDSPILRLLRDTPADEWPRLAEREEFRTASALEELEREFAPHAGRAPQEALALAELATAIADALPADASLRARAWKNRASATRILGRYDDTFAALDRAEAILEGGEGLAGERADLHLVRAVALMEAGRLDESLTLLPGCRQQYKQQRRPAEEIMCGILEAAMLHRTARYREAIDALQPLITAAEAAGDAFSLATIHNNIGHAAVELGDAYTAEAHLQEAARLMNELRRPVHVIHVQLARGRLMNRQGEIERGIRHLQSVREAYLEHGLVEEAGLCGLDIVDAWLSRGAIAEAEELARRIVAEFSGARLDRRAVTALGYLSDAIAAREASADTVEKVRHFIHALRTDPDAEFRAAG